MLNKDTFRLHWYNSTCTCAYDTPQTGYGVLLSVKNLNIISAKETILLNQSVKF